MNSPLRLVLIILCVAVRARSARVLLLLPTGGKSLKNVFYGMGRVLNERGHEIVFFNPYKPSSPVKGITEIVPDNLAALFADSPNMFRMNDGGFQANLKPFFRAFFDGSRTAFESKEVDQLLGEHFDLIILGPFAHVFYSLPYLKRVPFAVLTSVSYLPMFSSVLGTPTLPAVSPFPLTSNTNQMSFMQRIENMIVHFMMVNVLTGLERWDSDRLIANKFGKGIVPPTVEIERNMSVLFQNSNPVFDYHRPILPNVVEVGGLICIKPKPLPNHLQDFLGNSDFVFFSLGSMARPEDMPEELRTTILQALGSLQFKVLLKWDTSDRTDLPANILPSKWLPQQDILGNSRCRLFISHGGFNSVSESICHGVPMVTIPLAIDQKFNAANAARLGLAVPLSWEGLTTEKLVQAVRQALLPRVREAALYRRQLLREQPVSPHQLAVHWVEHVLQHGGAPHLRSVAADLHWLQYYSLDVLAFLLAVLALLLTLLAKLVACCFSRLCGRKQPSKNVRAKQD